MSRRTRIVAVSIAVDLLLMGAGGLWWIGTLRLGGPPGFEAQACSLPRAWLEMTQKGYFEPRSGQIAIIPRTPAYMASGAAGWSHSGPWDYLQRVPLVFYGPGHVPAVGEVDRAVTLADIAPTLATMLHGSQRGDGSNLDEVTTLEEAVRREPPRVIVVIVWDGGGWNTLEQWPGAWPNLARVMAEGVSFTNARVGSSPSVTPAVHTTIGTGSFPWVHGITGVPLRDEDGEVVDAFLKGDSARFLQIPTLAERWDEQNGNDALVGMIGYEPWHLGMIGKGAEKPGGDKDHAAWLNVETNEWIANPAHYELPRSLVNTPGREAYLAATDAIDGELDGAWRGHDILDDPARIEETPGFIDYHAAGLVNVMKSEGYGRDRVTDLMFTNFKQIDRIGHYYNMASPEVRDELVATDRALATIIDALDAEVGEGRWVLALTADHGQQPDAPAIDGFGIDPREIEHDIRARFGEDVVDAVWPTEVFLDERAMAAAGVTEADIAGFLADYRLADNLRGWEPRIKGVGTFAPRDRLFELAVPSRLLDGFSCS